MKIYNEVIIDMNTNETIYEDSFEYEGDIASCCGTTAYTSKEDYDKQQAEKQERMKVIEEKNVASQEKGYADSMDEAARTWGLEGLSMEQFYDIDAQGRKIPKDKWEIQKLILQHKPYDKAIHGASESKYKQNVMTQISKLMPKLEEPDVKKQGFLGEEKEIAEQKAGLAKQKAEDVYGLGISAASRQAQQEAGKLGTQMRGAYGGSSMGMRGAMGGQKELGGVYGEQVGQLGQQRGYAGTQYDLSMQQADLTQRKGVYDLEQQAEGDWETSMGQWMSGFGFKEGGRVPSKKTFLDILTKLPDAGGS